MYITIDKNVPLPDDLMRRVEYPFPDMEVGDSFVVAATHTKLYSAASYYGKRHKKKFKCRNDDDKIRCWRTA